MRKTLFVKIDYDTDDVNIDFIKNAIESFLEARTDIERTYLPPIGEIAGNELKECILIEHDCEVYGEL